MFFLYFFLNESSFLILSLSLSGIPGALFSGSCVYLATYMYEEFCLPFFFFSKLEWLFISPVIPVEVTYLRTKRSIQSFLNSVLVRSLNL